MPKKYIQGAEAACQGLIDGGAEIFFGYPITPSTEVMHAWVEACEKPDSHLKFLQTEDEISAGFAVIGGVLAGKKTVTTTAGPGNVLMQDAFSMAEALRLPTVAVIVQRGGPSTGTVIYSQQEVTLTCFGGNGEGLRIVYSTSGPQDLYDYSYKALQTAWNYHFPTFVLADGYQSKMMGEININNSSNPIHIPAHPFLIDKKYDPKNYHHIQNTYNTEEDLNAILIEYQRDFKTLAPKICEFEKYRTSDADLIILAHGIVAEAAKAAIDELRKQGNKVGLFRPITLSPFPVIDLQKTIKNINKIVIAESSLGQFSRLCRPYINNPKIKMIDYFQPALGITPERLIEFINNDVIASDPKERGNLYNK